MNLKEVKAILVIVTGLLVLFFFFLLKNDQPFIGLVYAAGIIGFVSLLSPRAGKGVVWLWFKLAFVLGWVNSRILLSAIYFVILVPLASLYRLFNKDTLNLKKPTGSLFSERKYTYQAKDLDNMW